MPLATNEVLKQRYQINKPLSQGGMGAVYLAFDTVLKKRVAIKENFLTTAAAAQQFEQEAIILANLNHPNLPRVTDHFRLGDTQYLVMDFIEGQDLWQILKQQRTPCPEHLALDYIIQICDTLMYLHHQSPPIIHRDIKPHNIKITSDGRAVLVDFGISKITTEGQATIIGARAASPGFAPPEQVLGSGTDASSDLYALGATFYTLLTAQVPPESMLRYNKQQTLPTIQQINPQVKAEINQAVQWAMAIEKSQRPPSVEHWKKHLLSLTSPTAPTVSAPKNMPTTPTVAPTVLGATVMAEMSYYLVHEQGQKYLLKGQPLIIGRQSGSDLHITNDDKISRQHAKIQLINQQCFVYDLNSANGTFINQQRVGAQGLPLPLDGVLTISQQKFRLEATTLPATSTANPTYIPPQQTVSTSAPTNKYAWDENEELGGIASATMMLTQHVAARVEAMGSAQLTALIMLITVIFGGVAYAANIYIRPTFPYIWQTFGTLYYIAGPLVFIMSRRKGSALGVHFLVHMLIAVLTWDMDDYGKALVGSGLMGGLILEIACNLTKIPGLLRFPIAVMAANLAHLLMIGNTPANALASSSLMGAIVTGFLIYTFSEAHKGYLKAMRQIRN